MPFIPNFDEFCDHENVPHLYDGFGRELFENGAVWNFEARVGYEPPAGQHERDKLQVEYQQIIVNQLRMQLTACESYIATQAEYALCGAGALPPPEAFTERASLRSRLVMAEGILATAQEKLAISPENLRRAEIQAQRAERRAQALEILKSLNTEN